MKNQKIKISCLLILLLLAFANNKAQEIPDDAPIKVNTVLLNVPVIVSDKNGRNIVGLKKEDFIVTQNGERQAIEYFADTETPINVAIVIDVSGSTKYVLDDIKKAAKSFLSVLGPEDKAMVVSFDYETHKLNKLTSDKKDLKDAINAAFIENPDGSNMYDPVYKILTKDFASIKGRKAIIVLTDGIVNGRKISRE